MSTPEPIIAASGTRAAPTIASVLPRVSRRKPGQEAPAATRIAAAVPAANPTFCIWSSRAFCGSSRRPFARLKLIPAQARVVTGDVSHDAAERSAPGDPQGAIASPSPCAPGRQPAQHPAARQIDLGDLVAAGLGGVEPPAVGGEEDA